MRVLLVEDTDNKRRELELFIENAIVGADVIVAKSLQAALKVMSSDVIDLVILDMSLPAFDISVSEDGFKHLPYAGCDVLEFIDSRDIDVLVVVVTAFGQFGQGLDVKTLTQLNAELTRDYQGIYLGYVTYSAIADQWRTDLLQILQENVRSIAHD
ncbi:MAG: response regulator [Gemmatimonadota bacterium]